MRSETILNVFPSADERQRLVIAVEQETSGGSSRLVLRQESLSDHVGWFIQSRVAIEPEQIPGLKMALSGGTAQKLRPPAHEVPRIPAILRFDRGVSGQVG